MQDIEKNHKVNIIFELDGEANNQSRKISFTE